MKTHQFVTKMPRAITLLDHIHARVRRACQEMVKIIALVSFVLNSCVTKGSAVSKDVVRITLADVISTHFNIIHYIHILCIYKQ